MSHGGPVHPDVVILAEVQELSAGELGAVVGDDGVRDPEAMDDVGEERHRLLGPDAVWGLDLVGPLPKAPGGYTHLLVAIDKFSKWIEVRPLNDIRSEQAVAFFTNIIHCFGVPNSIIIDNGTQFTGRKFLDFCEDHHIRVDWAAVAHPMTNG